MLRYALAKLLSPLERSIKAHVHDLLKRHFLTTLTTPISYLRNWPIDLHSPFLPVQDTVSTRLFPVAYLEPPPETQLARQ